MGNLFKQPIVIGIVIVAIVAAVVWSYFDNRAKEKAIEAEQEKVASEVISNLTNATPSDFDEFVKSEFSLAQNKALEANNNYKFAAIVIELPGSLLVNSGSDRYVYVNAKDSVNNWVITLDQKTQNYLRAIIPKSDYLGDLTPIDTSLWKYNFVTALQLAEKNGGKEWREANNTESVTLTLKHGEPQNFLSWTVEYSSGNETLVKKFDANSGKLLEN